MRRLDEAKGAAVSDELCIKAVQQVIRSIGELSGTWDGSTIDAAVQEQIEDVYRDVEIAREHLAAALGTGGE